MLLGTSPPALRMIRALAPLLPRRAAESIQGRLAATAGWLTWSPPRTGPLVWVHAASVGEALTALPIMSRLRAGRPAIVTILTFTSPSVAHWPGPLGTDRTGYLPPDDHSTMDALFRHLEPAALLFARGDLWPGLVAAGQRHGIPVLLVGGAVRPNSARLLSAARVALRRTYAAVRWAGAVSVADAERLCRLGVSAAATQVTGDPRHDQIIERPVSLSPGRDILSWAGPDPVMVAGSTHPEDERFLLDGLREVLRSSPGARLVLVPHAPRRLEVERLAASARASGLTSATLGAGAPGDARLLIGSGVGVLADLYVAATCAYVGGGFGRAGLHAVVEPAAFGIPVMFGQRDARLTADAAALVISGGGVAVSRRKAAATIAAQWLRWLQDRDGVRQSGLAARATLQSGASDVSARAIRALLPAQAG